ncbi:hypothetical protein BGX27_007582 [Mortierella sp. AM989]|nr:hypothetical protein BGX27_007582 [Mortierella sp. AM989]
MDGVLFPDSPTLRQITNRHTKNALIDMALRWINLYTITRIGRQNEEEESDNEYNHYMMIDSEDRNASVHKLSLAKYKEHVAKRYDGMREKSNKKAIIDRMLNVDWSTGLNSRQIADLDLAYYSQHSGLKNWKTLKLDYGDHAGIARPVIDPTRIEKIFSYHMAPYFKHHVQTLQDGEMVWIRISIHDGLAPNVLPTSTSVVYFIWFINSEYLLGATIKAEWKDFIMEALLRLFRASGIEEWPLTGKSPTSLAELLLHKDSQGSHSRYRLNQLDDNPLSGTTKKRKLEDPHQKYTRGMGDIRAEDQVKIASRDRFVAADFGPNPQPSLNRVDLQINLPYTAGAKDFNLGRLTKQSFPIKVVLEGSNVIEGIKSLIPLGVAQNPMPKFLTDLHSMGSNSITVDLENDEGNKQHNNKDSNDIPNLNSTVQGPVKVEPAVGVVSDDNHTEINLSISSPSTPQVASTRVPASALKNMPTKKLPTRDEVSSEAQLEDSTAALSSPVPISSTQLPRNAIGAGSGGPNISFSPLPQGRAFSESPQARRANEFTPSPARSFGQVLEFAESEQQRSSGQTTGEHDIMSTEGPWVAHASTATGTSAVHFQPQRGSHGHRARIGSGVGSSAWMGTSAPESRFSEFEVVYDDGIRKQRTFSLSTESDESSERTSSEYDGSERNPLLGYPNNQHHQHGNGEHEQENDTAKPSTSHNYTVPIFGKSNGHYNSTDGRLRHPPLRQSSNPIAYFYNRLLDAWDWITQFKLSLPNRRILKASLAYLFGCLVSFTPFFLPYVGASGHLAATSAVFFNPAKSLGRMVDAVTAGLCAISFGFLVSVGSMASAVWFNDRDLYVWGHIVSVIVFGGGSTFIIAFAKAHFNRPTVNVGKSSPLPKNMKCQNYRREADILFTFIDQ